MNYKETDDLWRLYRREWIVVHTLDPITVDAEANATGRAGLPIVEAGQQWVKDNLHGRVRDEDLRITLHTDQQGTFWGTVDLFKDNLKGEFKVVEHAQMFAQIEKYDEYVIVPRNSKSDHDIRNYGVVML